MGGRIEKERDLVMFCVSVNLGKFVIDPYGLIGLHSSANHLVDGWTQMDTDGWMDG